MNDYKIDTKNLPSFSGGRNIASDALRGFAVGVRGLLESRKMRREAADDKARRIADEAYRQRVLDLEERKVILDDAFRGEHLEANTNIQKRLTAVEEGKYDHAYEMFKLKTKADKDLVSLQSKLAETKAAADNARTQGNLELAAKLQQDQTQLEANIAEAQKTRDAANRLAEITATTEGQQAVTRTAGEESRKTLEQEGTQTIEQIRETGKEQRLTAQEENQAKLLLESLKNITGATDLDEESWKRYLGIFNETGQIEAVKDMASIAQGYQTAMQGYVSAISGGESRTLVEQQVAASVGKTEQQVQQEIDVNRHLLGGAGFTMADMAIMNGYQRMIDPGVSVREGDVQALLSALGAGGQLQATWASILEGGRFTDESRTKMAAIILDNYRSNLRNTWHTIENPINNLISRSGLAPTGVVMQEFLPGWVDLAGVTPADIVRTRDPYAGKLNQGEPPTDKIVPDATTSPPTLKPETVVKVTDYVAKQAQSLYDADPTFDENDKATLRQMVTETLTDGAKQLGFAPEPLLDRYTDTIYNAVLEKLGVATETDPQPPNPMNKRRRRNE